MKNHRRGHVVILLVCALCCIAFSGCTMRTQGTELERIDQLTQQIDVLRILYMVLILAFLVQTVTGYLWLKRLETGERRTQSDTQQGDQYDEEDVYDDEEAPAPAQQQPPSRAPERQAPIHTRGMYDTYEDERPQEYTEPRRSGPRTPAYAYDPEERQEGRFDERFEERYEDRHEEERPLRRARPAPPLPKTRSGREIPVIDEEEPPSFPM